MRSNSGDSSGSGGALGRRGLDGADDSPRVIELARERTLRRAPPARVSTPGPLASNESPSRLSSGRAPPLPVVPETRGRVKAVERQELPAFVRDQVHGREDVVEHGLAHEVVEADARERELRTEPAEPGLLIHARRPGVVDRIHAVDVRAGAEAPLRVWIPNRSLSNATTKFECSSPRGWRTPSVTIASRSSSGLPRIRTFGLAAQDASARRAKARSRRRISSVPTASLSANTSPARIDSTIAGVPPLLADLRVWVVPCSGRADEQDRPAARYRRHAVAQQRALGDEDARASRARRRTCAATGTPRPCRRGGRRTPPGFMSIGRYGPAARVVPARQRAVPVQRVATRSTSVTIPVTFEAAEKLPTFSGGPRGGAARPRGGRGRRGRRRPRGS